MGRDQDGGATKGVVSPVGDVVEYVFHGAIDWNDHKNILKREEQKKRKENPRNCLKRVSGLDFWWGGGVSGVGMCQVTTVKRGQVLFMSIGVYRRISPNVLV